MTEARTTPDSRPDSPEPTAADRAANRPTSAPIGRDDPASRRPPLLVVADDEAPESTTVRMPLTVTQIARRHEASALREVGERLNTLVDCLVRFQDENDAALAEIDEAVGDQSRARLMNRVRVLREISAWAREVAHDLQSEARTAARGWRVVAAHQLMVEAGEVVEEHYPDVRVTIAPSTVRRRTRAMVADLTEAFFLGLACVAERIGSWGGIQVDVEDQGSVAVYRIRGIGTPHPITASEAVARLREIVHEHGGRIAPGPGGPEGLSLDLELPLV